MDGLAVLVLGMLALALFGALALRFGVDSRPGSDDPRQSSPGLSV